MSLGLNDGSSIFCVVKSRIDIKQFAAVIVFAEEAARIHPGWIVQLPYMGFTYARSGSAEDARRVLEELHSPSENSGYLCANAVTAVHVALAEMQTAAELLDRPLTGGN